jgi:hypothetical protein
MHKVPRGLVTRDLCKKYLIWQRFFRNYSTVVYSEIISSLPQSKGYPFPGIFSLCESILFFKFSGREPLYSISVSSMFKGGHRYLLSLIGIGMDE